MKAVKITCDIYKNGYDCSNGGVSATHGTVLLVNGEAWETMSADQRAFLTNGNVPVVRTVKRLLGQELYVHAEPVDRPEAGNRGWMAGGTFIKTSDSRYKEVTGVSYPVSLHDRQETAELSRALSI